jgi:isopentenyl-diphosphate delta-isomerase
VTGAATAGSATPAELVVCVDAADRSVGSCEKLAAHQPPGIRHRAFSVLLFDAEDRLLLQRRAATKHHFGRCWSNSVCSHPRPGEDIVCAGRRRVQEELGLRVELEAAGRFEYRAVDAHSGLVEHEIDHVLIGRTGLTPQPDPGEVSELRWTSAADLAGWLERDPQAFTPWMVLALRAVSDCTQLPSAFSAPAESPWTS